MDILELLSVRTSSAGALVHFGTHQALIPFSGVLTIAPCVALTFRDAMVAGGIVAMVCWCPLMSSALT